MTDHTQSEQRLSEDDVENLLQRFFADEMPVEYQSSETAHTAPAIYRAVAELPTSSKESRQLASYMAVAVSTICCLLVIFLSPNEDKPTSTKTTSGEETFTPAEEADDFVPVEDREHLRFSKLGVDEESESPDSGSEEAVVPELEIEIFPLRPDKPKSFE